jgi:hypothetical protein
VVFLEGGPVEPSRSVRVWKSPLTHFKAAR